MKRVIKASVAGNVIFEDENFIFRKESGVGMQDTPWNGLRVDSKGLAEKHVVEVRLTPVNSDFNGEPITFRYRDVYVGNGMRSVVSTLDETLELSDVLADAVDFAYRVIDWIRDNDEYNAGM